MTIGSSTDIDMPEAPVEGAYEAPQDATATSSKKVEVPGDWAEKQPSLALMAHSARATASVTLSGIRRLSTVPDLTTEDREAVLRMEARMVSTTKDYTDLVRKLGN